MLDEIMLHCKSQVIICGDFNSHNPIWGSTNLDANGRIVEDFMHRSDLVILNEGNPTRLDPHSGRLSCLDLALTSKELSSVCKWSVLKHNFGSDHFVVSFDIPFLSPNKKEEIESTKSYASRSYENINWNLYKLEINNQIQECKMQYQESDIQGKYNILIRIILASIDKLTKVRHKHKAKPPVPWWNKECSTASKNRNAAKNRFMHKTLLYEDFQIYIEKKRIAQMVFRSAKREYWKEYCRKFSRTADIGTVWKRIKGIKKGKKQTIPNLIMEAGKVIGETAKEKATIFLNVFTTLDLNMEKEEAERRAEIEANFLDVVKHMGNHEDNVLNEDFNMDELKSAIKELKDTAPGNDGILNKLIKHLPEETVKLILELYNEIWDKGLLPCQWIEAIQIPVLKQGKDASNPSSYRPISLTPTFCKLMERLVKNRLSWYIEKNNIITPIQSGFMERRSTIDHLVKLETDIHKGMVNKEYSVVIFLDLEKAYDVVWRQGIVCKLYELGFSGKILKWIHAFMTNRVSRVRVDNYTTEPKKCNIGIPQGSVISPLLYNFMINDLEEVKDSVEIAV